MRIGPLILLKGCVIAWHWQWSLTWRWGVWVLRHRRGTKLGWLKVRLYQGDGLLLALNTPIGDVHFQSQPNMRREVDVWRVNRDEAYQAYARALGRDLLTDEEKQAALLNEVIESGQALLETEV